MKNGHESVMELLLDNGADISCADVGCLACIAVELDNLKLLKNIVQCGGDVAQTTSYGTTALHAAVCEGNVEMVKFLLDHGADIHKQDGNGMTPISLADQQCHDEILNIFKKVGHNKTTQGITTTISFASRTQSAPIIPATTHGRKPSNEELTWFDSHQKRRVINPYHNSFFGMMSRAHYGKHALIYLLNFDLFFSNLHCIFSSGSYFFVLHVFKYKNGLNYRYIDK